MAKFAYIGYGRDGRGVGTTESGYTYVVSDTVRTGDVLQPIATSSAGRKFVTTGRVNHSASENTATGQQMKQKAEENGATSITKAYTGREVGAKGNIFETKDGNAVNEYAMSARAGNLQMELQKHPDTELSKGAQKTLEQYGNKYQTFEEYSKPFMGGK